jgi:formate dehydrogenase maturation protein FdhE
LYCPDDSSRQKHASQLDTLAVGLPIADDLALLGLDVLVGEAGYRRHAANPLIP